MIRGKRVCAIIPARGGSKGIPLKNLYRLGGVTLVERALHLGKSCKSVDVVYVSTDDPETYAIAQANGCATPSLRPAVLATDSARTIDVIKDLADEGVLGPDDCVLLLQPTSPLRTTEDLNSVCALLDAKWDSADAVVSVSSIDGPHPYKAQIIGGDGYLQSVYARDSSVPRQSLPVTYFPNGAFYLGKIEVLVKENTFVPRRSLPFVMSQMASINLDGPLDLILLEAILCKGLVQLPDGPKPMTPPTKPNG
jgi:CMP-N-acetylneuraminic acid synthetase